MNCYHCQQLNRTDARFCSNCRAPLFLQNKYRVTAQLGSGGFGSVYYAQQTNLGNLPCALKELVPDAKATPQQLQHAATQFQLEASILARLSDPALPRVTDFFNEGNRYYLVMEYVDGETLEERLQRVNAPLPEGEVIAYANVLCDTLTYLHTQKPNPVIHRDIKPSNIKITSQGRGKLLDFGIAKLLAGTGNTLTAARAVTPPYAPLEQYGKGKGTDARTDIYALGVTLYQLLTNQLPPEAPDRASEAVISPRQYNRTLSVGTENAILKAMAMNPANRHQDAQEFKRALQPTAPLPKHAPQGIHTPPVPVAPNMNVVGTAPIVSAPRKKSNRWMWWVVGTGVVLSAILCAPLGLASVFRAPAAQPTAPPPTVVALVNTPVVPSISEPNQQLQKSELYAAAKQEGMLSVIALPHDWCNYGPMIENFKRKYPGIIVNELNPDAGSGDEIEAIKANKDNKGPSNPDVIDVGFAFGESAKTEGLLQPYKVSTWDTIPDIAKDSGGYWYGNYFGVMSFMVNTDVVKNVPNDWSDLLKPEYKNQIGLSGDPRTSNQAIQTVYAAALASGGSLNNARPGLDYFSRLFKQGNLNMTIANNSLVANGATPIRLTWTYNALAGRDSMNNNPKIKVIVPESNKYGAGYVNAISAYAPHPNAAKLWMEYIYSDEGQLGFLEAPYYCYPIRFQDLRARNVVPSALLDTIPNIDGVVFANTNQLVNARDLVTKQWDSIVGADIKSAQ